MATGNGEALGWEVGTFALDRLQPDAASAAGSSALWKSYCDWCEKRKVVPLAFAVFYREFEAIADAVGISRRQVGAHVLYEGVGLKGV